MEEFHIFIAMHLLPSLLKGLVLCCNFYPFLFSHPTGGASFCLSRCFLLISSVKLLSFQNSKKQLVIPLLCGISVEIQATMFCLPACIRSSHEVCRTILSFLHTFYVQISVMALNHLDITVYIPSVLISWIYVPFE